MKLQRLPWAGIRLENEQGAVLIDPVSRILEQFGGSKEPMYPLDHFGGADAVLITHLHEDHFDPEAIARAFGADIPVYVPEEAAETARKSGLSTVTGVKLGASLELANGITAIAAPAVDGLGHPQVSWVVKSGGKTVFHGGDTLWHGHWWKIASKYGPIDAACLPVNGAIMEYPGLTPSGEPICLTPEQAVSAAVVLGAGVLVPIHYKAIHHPPLYSETPDIDSRLEKASIGKIKLNAIKATESIIL
ncbi:MBL fold metallo-hydrolase [Paenibacillus sp. GCM10027627]|uniref:MBL fold metallo-hydrolase n=1 Tax=unclassified Paenibacillus TaxID=185978 RepID=UPI00362B5819